ncbi:CGNR zinc finger domain-containing protein [Saxibacter everestensis]|uniref:CGNR zinc finger domain-containing protein n=1 Tax=Saxibacter everestensis TaxID=2909229 RepID=A0ABY8QS19_9MICO|nr:CGNR zinc finger domain-containing protein [Brevibacteriaceae bacterium ZFBP1038]
MHVNPYGEGAVKLGVVLANAAPTSMSKIRSYCQEAGLLLPNDSIDGVSYVREFIDEWATLADIAEPEGRANTLNALLALHTQTPSITNHAGDGWHLHFRSLELPSPRVITAFISAGTALHFVNRGIQRLSRCADLTCRKVFADFSRPGSQRYCSNPCANRDAVRRHRSRQALGQAR